jgi:hypothetical protein
MRSEAWNRVFEDRSGAIKIGSMKPERIPEISPLIEKWHPHATRAEQRQYTQEFRAYLTVLYRIFLQLEGESLLPSDSRESERDAMLESDNLPQS